MNPPQVYKWGLDIHNLITLAFHNLTLRSLLKRKSEGDCITTVCAPWKASSTFHKEKRICYFYTEGQKMKSEFSNLGFKLYSNVFRKKVHIFTPGQPSPFLSPHWPSFRPGDSQNLPLGIFHLPLTLLFTDIPPHPQVPLMCALTSLTSRGPQPSTASCLSHLLVAELTSQRLGHWAAWTLGGAGPGWKTA